RNPANGREVVVRINDRGPFHPGRIVDLSYAAALRLDLLRGVAPVELERITFDDIRTGAWRGGGGVRVAMAGAALVDGDVAVAMPTPTSQVAIAAPSVAASPAPATTVPAQDIAFVVAPATIAPPALPQSAEPSAVRAASEAARGFWMQLGAFRERDGAESFQRRIGADAAASWLAPVLAVFGDARYFRVQAGPYASRGEADDAALRVRSTLGVVPLIVDRR
ncbi:MAG: SPOR domain-containing protein, partial [Caldimonas sp.]